MCIYIYIYIYIYIFTVYMCICVIACSISHRLHDISQHTSCCDVQCSRGMDTNNKWRPAEPFACELPWRFHGKLRHRRAGLSYPAPNAQYFTAHQNSKAASTSEPAKLQALQKAALHQTHRCLVKLNWHKCSKQWPWSVTSGGPQSLRALSGREKPRRVAHSACARARPAATGKK